MHQCCACLFDSSNIFDFDEVMLDNAALTGNLMVMASTGHFGAESSILQPKLSAKSKLLLAFSEIQANLPLYLMLMSLAMNLKTTSFSDE